MTDANADQLGPSTEPEAATDSIWAFERVRRSSVSDISYPDIPAIAQQEEEWRGRLHKIFRLRRRSSRDDGELDESQFREADLPPPDPQLLERYVPRPEDWSVINSPTLDDLFDSACKEKSSSPVHHHAIFVRRPHSPVDEIVAAVAHEREFSIIKPPTPQEILDGNNSWLQRWQKNESDRLACVNLEKCFLNSHRGLSLMRRLIRWLWTTEKTCVFVCSSWAFNYLIGVVPLTSVLSAPIFLQPFDAAKLKQWFEGIVQVPGSTYAIVEAGDPSVAIIESPQADPDTHAQESDLLQDMANYTRGNPGIAWRLWRTNIFGGPKSADKPDRATLYVRDWRVIHRILPRIREETRSPTCAVILYSLLLHDGLSEQILAQILPFYLAQITSSMNRLSMRPTIRLSKNDPEIQVLSGLVDFDSETGNWYVPEPAYRNVTTYLRDQRFKIPGEVY